MKYSDIEYYINLYNTDEILIVNLNYQLFSDIGKDICCSNYKKYNKFSHNGINFSKTSQNSAMIFNFKNGLRLIFEKILSENERIIKKLLE